MSLTYSFTEGLPIEKFSETLGIKSKEDSERKGNSTRVTRENDYDFSQAIWEGSPYRCLKCTEKILYNRGISIP